MKPRAKLGLVVAGLLSVSTLALASRKLVAPKEVPVSVPEAPHLPTYEEAVSDALLARRTAEVLADEAPGSWSRRAKAAAMQLGYAQLTGDFPSYAAAEKSLAEAFRVSRRSIDDPAVGPHLLNVQLSFELHRMNDALAALEVPERQATAFHDKKMLAQLTSLRGAITFALGTYDEGLAHMRKAVELDGTAAYKQRLALALVKVGADDEAASLFDETGKLEATPRQQSWLAVQRSNFAREHGRRREERVHLEFAVKAFPGGWQAQERLAELDVDEGHVDRAIASYRDLIARTSDPEFMDHLALLLSERAPSEASELRARAHRLYEERLTILPEATYGHALEHFLRMVEDPSRSLTLARRNVELRPDGEARTRLAQAFLRNGLLLEAKAEIERVLATKWTNAETLATAAVVFRAAGDSGAEADAEARAKARNPHAMEDIAWLRVPPRKP